MKPRTPPLYATGKWVIESPFTLVANGVYVCKAVRSFDDLSALGIDPYTQYYEPMGLDINKYRQDVLSLANIVTLMSDTHPTVYVPDTYIKSYPDTTTVPYRHVVLSLSLGAVPDTLVLDDLKDKIQEYTLSSLGLEVKVKEHQAGSISEGVDQVTHLTLENNRLARIENNTTQFAKVSEAEALIVRLREENLILTNILLEAGLLPQ